MCFVTPLVTCLNLDMNLGVIEAWISIAGYCNVSTDKGQASVTDTTDNLCCDLAHLFF